MNLGFAISIEIRGKNRRLTDNFATSTLAVELGVMKTMIIAHKEWSFIDSIAAEHMK